VKSTQLLLLAMMASVPLAPAHALDVLETQRSNPTGNCEGSRPSDRDALRHRPLALVNEYSLDPAPVFITCAFSSPDEALGISVFGSRFTNLSNATVTVNCTGVVGEEGSPRYYPKALTLAPLASGSLSWSGNDNGNLLFGDRLSLSCTLPADVAANDNFVGYLLSIL
jgi:hypothetical protein